MVNPIKVPAALYAVHSILVKGRWLAREGGEPGTLYKLLDWAEALPSLIVRRNEDTTEEFRQMLAGLGEELPDCRGILKNFDNGVAWETHSAHAIGSSGDAK